MRFGKLIWSAAALSIAAWVPASSGGYVPVCSGPNSAPAGTNSSPDSHSRHHHNLVLGNPIPISISFNQAVLPPSNQEVDFCFWTAKITPNQGSMGYTYSGANYLTVSPYTTKIPGLAQTGLISMGANTNWQMGNAANSNWLPLQSASATPSPLTSVSFGLPVDSDLAANQYQDFLIYYEVHLKPALGGPGALLDSGVKVIHLYGAGTIATPSPANFWMSTQINAINDMPTMPTAPSIATWLNFSYLLSNQNQTPAPPAQMMFWSAPLQTTQGGSVATFDRTGKTQFVIARSSDPLPIDPNSLGAFPYSPTRSSSARLATLTGVPGSASAFSQIPVPASFATVVDNADNPLPTGFLYFELDDQFGNELDSSGKFFTFSRIP